MSESCWVATCLCFLALDLGLTVLDWGKPSCFCNLRQVEISRRSYLVTSRSTLRIKASVWLFNFPSHMHLKWVAKATLIVTLWVRIKSLNLISKTKFDLAAALKHKYFNQARSRSRSSATLIKSYLVEKILKIPYLLICRTLWYKHHNIMKTYHTL